MAIRLRPIQTGVTGPISARGDRDDGSPAITRSVEPLWFITALALEPGQVRLPAWAGASVFMLIVLALVLGIFSHDTMRPADGASPWLQSVSTQWGGPAWAWLIALMILPRALILGLYALGVRWLLKRLPTHRAPLAFIALERAGLAMRFALVALFGAELAAGGLVVLREGIGDGLLIDELLFMAPTLLTLLGLAALYYPVELRMREAMVLRQLDEGHPLPPVLSRGQFVLNVARHQYAIVLAPLLLIMAWAETLVLLEVDQASYGWLMVGGVAVVFLVSPLIIRAIWDTVRLPDGEIRERLLAMCRRHRVGVRELLLWRTFGGMLNAAVMGLFAPLRFILMTDSLIERLPVREVEAVMAHELGHVRRRHIVWLLASAGATIWTLELVASTVLNLALPSPLDGPRDDPAQVEPVLAGVMASILAILADPVIVETTAALVVVGVWALIFGWVSRRYERQADAFAVQHLAMERHEAAGQVGTVVVDPGSVRVVISALQHVAEGNHQPPARPSWRHGSIAWRQAYLRTLIGRPVLDLPIDRVVRRINIAATAALLTLAATQALSWL